LKKDKVFSNEITRHDLKRLRKKYKKTQSEMGVVLGVTKQTISNLETGRIEMTKMSKEFIRVFKILNFFECDKLIQIILDREI